MKRTILSIIIALLIPAVCFCSPIASFDKTTIELGEVYVGQNVSAVFNLTNTGDEVLQIKDIKLSCPSCTKIQPYLKELKPNESTKIEVSITSVNSGAAISKSLSVITNDQSKPPVLLKITGITAKIANINPANLYLSNVKVNSTTIQKITVVPVKPLGFGISGIMNPSKKINCTYKLSDKQKNSYEITATIKADATPGRINDKINIITSLPNNPMITISVYGNIVE